MTTTIETTSTVDASTYWATVLGDLTESQAVEAHGLSALSHSELMAWLETCEATARDAGATGLDDVFGLRWDAAAALAEVSATTFVCTSEDGSPVEVTAATAREAAELYAADEVSADDRTAFVNVLVAPVGNAVAAEWHKVQVDPEEPDCDDVDHAWQDGPVRGNGGGVVYTDTCAHCGCRRHIDTWGTDAFDGTQGHRIVRYLPAVS
jgi:hypothetical protein